MAQNAPAGISPGFAQDAGGELNGKRLELLKETLPNLSHVGILWNPGVASNRSLLTSMGDSAQGMGLTLVPVEAPGQDAFGQVFTTMMKERMEAFVILGDAVLFNYRGQIAEMAMRNRLPAVSGFKEIAEAGLLLTYGANVRDLFRRSAIFVDKILKGAKPTDLPVEQPTKFELVVNLNTPKALGVVVPPSLLLRADEVIEQFG